jgi:hypothetical protein
MHNIVPQGDVRCVDIYSLPDCPALIDLRQANSFESRAVERLADLLKQTAVQIYVNNPYELVSTLNSMGLSTECVPLDEQDLYELIER